VHIATFSSLGVIDRQVTIAADTCRSMTLDTQQLRDVVHETLQVQRCLIHHGMTCGKLEHLESNILELEKLTKELDEYVSLLGKFSLWHCKLLVI
jgi:hypothetical protein